MEMKNIPFGTTIWSQIVPTEHTEGTQSSPHFVRPNSPPAIRHS